MSNWKPIQDIRLLFSLYKIRDNYNPSSDFEILGTDEKLCEDGNCHMKKITLSLLYDSTQIHSEANVYWEKTEEDKKHEKVMEDTKKRANQIKCMVTDRFPSTPEMDLQF